MDDSVNAIKDPSVAITELTVGVAGLHGLDLTVGYHTSSTTDVAS
jgi:hypothetical protein